MTGGQSNISYGLPQRHIINRTFVTLMMDAGMDSAIIDPLEKKFWPLSEPQTSFWAMTSTA